MPSTTTLSETDLATVCALAFDYIADCTAFDPHTGRARNATTGNEIGTFPPIVAGGGIVYQFPVSLRPGATVSIYFPT